MSFLTQTPAYSIADGDHAFAAEIIDRPRAAVQLQYSDIDTDDVRSELHQSVNGSQFNILPGSQVILDKNAPSHLWNIEGLPSGMFIRVKIYQGTATAGTIDKIFILF